MGADPLEPLRRLEECPECGYSLAGAPHGGAGASSGGELSRCPECGFTYDDSLRLLDAFALLGNPRVWTWRALVWPVVILVLGALTLTAVDEIVVILWLIIVPVVLFFVATAVRPRKGKSVQLLVGRDGLGAIKGDPPLTPDELSWDLDPEEMVRLSPTEYYCAIAWKRVELISLLPLRGDTWRLRIHSVYPHEPKPERSVTEYVLRGEESHVRAVVDSLDSLRRDAPVPADETTEPRERVGLALKSCPHCGYELKGLPQSHICPECGEEFREDWWSLAVWDDDDQPRVWHTGFNGFGFLLFLSLSFTMLMQLPLGCVQFFMYGLTLVFGATFYTSIRNAIKHRQGRTDRTLVFTNRGYALVHEAGHAIAHGEWREVESFTLSPTPSRWWLLKIRHAGRSIVRGPNVSLVFEADEATVDRVRERIQREIERAREGITTEHAESTEEDVNHGQ